MPALPTRITLGQYPTPLEEISRFRAALGGGPRIFIKRDDLTGPGFGGNKVRKLEYVLADAVSQHADVVITTGGETSNHCRITAALCAKLGLRCVLVLNRSSRSTIPASRYLDELYGAEIVTVENRLDRKPTMARLAIELQSQGHKPYVIPLGASTPLGALGYADAIGELKAQGIAPHYIFHSSSSGGTQSGILAGCIVHGLTTQVVGVSPDDPSQEISAEVRRILAGIEKLLGRPLPCEPLVLDDFFGEGYGIPTAASEEATSLLARTEGIVLDPSYTAKAMAALIAWHREGRFKAEDTVLFWHTGGQLGLFSR
jgi:D-cysteine desulfhydrase family pyridoxal phosphate-dependent enzyme